MLEMIAAGGNVYYLAKLAGIFGLDVQDLGAQQTGMTKDAFKAAARRRGELTMAKIVGGIMTSHVPAIGRAIARNLQGDPYWKPWFDGFPPVHHWLAEVKPDVAVVVYNDHGLNFFLDKMPTFAVGAAPEYRNADEGWGIPVVPPFQGDPELSWHLIESLVRDEFDITTCQEMLVDHAFTLADGTAVARAGRLAGAHRAGVHQHGAVPAAHARRAAGSSARRSAARSRPGTATRTSS